MTARIEGESLGGPTGAHPAGRVGNLHRVSFAVANVTGVLASGRTA